MHQDVSQLRYLVDYNRVAVRQSNCFAALTEKKFAVVTMRQSHDENRSVLLDHK